MREVADVGGGEMSGEGECGIPMDDETDPTGENDPDIAVLRSGSRWTATIRSENGFVTIESDVREEAVSYARVAKRLFRSD